MHWQALQHTTAPRVSSLLRRAYNMPLTSILHALCHSSRLCSTQQHSGLVYLSQASNMPLTPLVHHAYHTHLVSPLSCTESEFAGCATHQNMCISAYAPLTLGVEDVTLADADRDCRQSSSARKGCN